jgi:UDP-glucose 4-epimerase
MRVIVTGATGNVGTSLLGALADDPSVEGIVGIARRRPGWQPPKVTWVEADTVVDDLVGLFRGADVVVHLAWIFQPTHDPLRTWRSNVLGSLRVFDAAADAGVGALVHASSVGAYSPGPQEGFVDESWPTHALPTAAYGREKSYLERCLDAYEPRHPDMRVVRLRPGFIFKRTSGCRRCTARTPRTPSTVRSCGTCTARSTWLRIRCWTRASWRSSSTPGWSAPRGRSCVPWWRPLGGSMRCPPRRRCWTSR